MEKNRDNHANQRHVSSQSAAMVESKTDRASDQTNDLRGDSRFAVGLDSDAKIQHENSGDGSEHDQDGTPGPGYGLGNRFDLGTDLIAGPL